jgi:AraC-like DNA-binding protein
MGSGRRSGGLVIIFDTADHPAADDRVDAFQAALNGAGVFCNLIHDVQPEDVQAQVATWDLGGAVLVGTRSTGFTIDRGARHVRAGPEPVVGVVMQTRGGGRYEKAGLQHAVGPGDLMMTDLQAPFSYGWSGAGLSRALMVDYDRLALPPDIVHKAILNLPGSPLYGLFRNHLDALGAAHERSGPDTDPVPGLEALNSATIELMRALVAAAAQDERYTRQVRADTMLTRVLAYARWHLTDPELSPERIARAHNISVRLLYKLFGQADMSLEQWIITQRLEGARRDLASPQGRLRTIAAVSRSWGFTDPSHFARRFRQTYGVLPRDWQRATSTPS